MMRPTANAHRLLRDRPARRPVASAAVSALVAVGLCAPPLWAAPSEGCTKGPAEALRSGDAEAAEDALRKALADGACGPVAPELRLRLAQVLADNHDGEPGPACEAMGLYRRIAAESDDALVQSDAAARADRLGPICAGEVPADGDGGKTAADDPADGTTAPGVVATTPPAPARAPGTTEWALAIGSGALLAAGGLLVVASQFELADRDAAHRDYLAAPFGSPAEAEAADRFESEQASAQALLISGITTAGVGAILGITAVAMWPTGEGGSAADAPAEPSARLVVGPTGIGLLGVW